MNTQNEFAAANLTLGQLNAIVKKLGGEANALKLLRDEFTVSEPVRNWREVDGIIYFSVTSNGKTGQEWMDYFKTKKIVVGDWAKQLLESPDFQPTNGVTTEIAVLKGMLFNDSDRVTKNIRNEADRRGWSKPNAEVACLIRDMFTDEELKTMGLYWIVVMHEPILDSGGNPNLFSADRSDGSYLGAYYGKPDDRWNPDNGFAFAISQVSLPS